MSTAQSDESPSKRLRPRAWGIWSNSAQLIALLLGLEVCAIALTVWSIGRLHPTSILLERTLLLTLLGILFEEASRRVADLRLRVAGLSYFDMTSVWTLASAIVLPPALATALVVVVRFYMWYRYQRSTRNHVYRHVYTCASIVLACHAAHAVMGATPGLLHGFSGEVALGIAVFLTVFMYRAVQAACIAAAMYLANRPTPFLPLFGDREANVFEIATLCLGGMTALLVEADLWLALLVVIPMVVLQRGALVKELAHAATTDAKTGLLNHGAWSRLAERELARIARVKDAAAVLVLDMDHFKLLNDDHGHLVGDVALKAAADALTAELRGYDLIGRFGGEEFVVLLPGVQVEAALLAAERVRQRIGQLNVGGREAGLIGPVLSVSVGIACFPENGDELTHLLQAADIALYAAKRAGRDRVMAAAVPTGIGE